MNSESEMTAVMWTKAEGIVRQLLVASWVKHLSLPLEYEALKMRCRLATQLEIICISYISSLLAGVSQSV
jgi:hypothetical protein